MIDGGRDTSGASRARLRLRPLRRRRGPACFKCRKRDDRRVETGIAEDGVVIWVCPDCGTNGQISNWQGTFWDLSLGMPSD